MSRRRRLLAPLYPRGFTPTLQRQLPLSGHLRPFAFETYDRFALLFVRSFTTRVATTTSADFSAPRARRPFRPQAESSPGKNAVLHRTTAGFTSPELWSSQLRGPLPARPARRRLRSGSCTSAHGLAPRFLPTLGHPRTVAVRFDQDDLLRAGLAPARQRPCWAHKENRGIEAFSIPRLSRCAGGNHTWTTGFTVQIEVRVA